MTEKEILAKLRLTTLPDEAIYDHNLDKKGENGYVLLRIRVLTEACDVYNMIILINGKRWENQPLIQFIYNVGKSEKPKEIAKMIYEGITYWEPEKELSHE